MAIELPELRTVTIDGAPVAYREWDGPDGGPAILLIHGLGGAHVNWVSVAPGLSGLGRVVALDLPGFGYTPRAGRVCGLMDLRRVVSGFCAEVIGGPVVLVGNSMGGGIAQLHAAVEPSSVAGVVLTCSLFPLVRGRWPSPLVTGAFAVYDTVGVGEAIVEARMARMRPEQIVRTAMWMVSGKKGSIPEEVVRLHVEALGATRLDPGAEGAFLDAARSIMRLERRPEVFARAMDGIRAPVLVLHGRRDRLVPAAYAEAALRQHPSWRGRIFADLGHVPMLEAPGRWLTEVADWWSGAGIGA